MEIPKESQSSDSISAVDIFKEMVISKEPSVSFSAAKVLGMINYPVPDVKTFVKHIQNIEFDEKTTKYYRAVSNYIISVFSSSDLPILTVQGAIEKLFEKLEKEKTVIRTPSSNGDCKCSSGTAPSRTVPGGTVPPGTVLRPRSYLGYQQCLSRRPESDDITDIAAYEDFCLCLYQSDRDPISCLQDYIRYLLPPQTE